MRVPRLTPSLVGRLAAALLFATCALAQQSAIPAAPVAPIHGAETELKVECLPASRASELIDKHGCVAGKVFRVTSAKSGATHLSLCPPESDCSFHVFIRADDREAVGDLSYLHGRFVAVVGDVTKYRGHAEIVVKDRQQIRVLASDPPKQFNTDQSKPGSGGQSPYGSKHGRAW